MRALFDALSSLKLTIFCLVLSMVLVLLGTLAQVHVGIYEAQKQYFSSFLVYWETSGGLSIPFLPGGALLGALLLLNLACRYLTNLKNYLRKPGLMLTHVGLIVLLLGGYVATFSAVESQMFIDEGQTANYSVSSRDSEMVVIDTTDPSHDEVVSIPQSYFSRKKTIQHERLPFTLVIRDYWPNADLNTRRENDPPSIATRDLGTLVTAKPAEAIATDDRINFATAYVEIFDGNQSLGVWLLSVGLRESQRLSHKGRSYEMAIRSTRHYLPYTLTLKDFTHDKYPGTDIPRNFSSLIRLTHKERNEDRDVLIYMNHPLRYDGKTFYQSSFGKNDTMSVLQVVENPGWLLPYVSCALITLGLAVHFLSYLFVFARRPR